MRPPRPPLLGSAPAPPLIALIGVAALLAAPVLVFRGVPMTDLAHHEGMVALLARWGDPRFTQGIYALNLGHANQLFYALAWPIALLFGSELACRIVVAAAVVATFAGAARLCDHVGATRWAALLVAPAAMGWTFFFGFAPNLVGVALFLFALPALDRLAESPAAKRAAAACALVLLLHAAHETSALCACVAIAVLSLGRRGGALAWLLRATPIAIGALLAWIEMRAEAPVLTAFGRRWVDKGIELHPIDKKLEYVGDFLMGPQGALPEILVAVIAIVALGALLATRAAKSEAGASPDLRASAVRHRFEILAAVFFALYVVMPFSVNFGAFLYVRFLAPAYVIAVVTLARGTTPSRIARSLCAAMPAAWLVVVLPQFVHADRERRMVDALMLRIEEGSAVAVLGYGSQGGLRPYDPLSLGNRVLAERGGRALHSFVEYPIAPVVVRPGLRWDEATMRVYITPLRFRPAFDLTRFRYLLLRIPDAELAALVARALAPDARLLAREGAWSLLESTHPTVPIDAPDAPPPEPPPPTIQDQVSAARLQVR